MKLIDGTALAKTIRASVKEAVLASGRQPSLATIRAGSDPSSQIYLRLKERACREVGIRFERKDFPESTAEQELIAHVKELNARKDIHGILVQLPLPSTLNPDPVIAAMDPEKDVDGFHPTNLAALEEGRPTIIPVLLKTVLALVELTGEQFSGKQVMILSKSDVFTRPFQYILTERGAIVTRSETLQTELTRSADILITALGKPRCITGNMIKDGATVIDIGITPSKGGVLGDVDGTSVGDKPGWLTPVPGGVGPVTVAMLMENVALAAGMTVMRNGTTP